MNYSNEGNFKNISDYRITPAERREMVLKKRIELKNQFRGEKFELVSRAVDECPSMYQNQFLDSLLGKAPVKTAIKMQCFSCIGWSGVKEAVSDCRGYMCPLYQYRPYK